MKTTLKALLALLVLGAALPGGAFGDGSSFSEAQSPSDQLFHIDVSASYLNYGQKPGDKNYGIGTIKVSLPGSSARLDSVLAVEPSGYNCSVTNSTYGETGTGFVCSTDGQPQGSGLGFPTTVTLHLLSQGCYAPPPEGSAQPAVAEVWAVQADPGSAPDATFPLYADPGCDTGDQLPVDRVPTGNCLVPKLKNVTLKKATQKLRRFGCMRGRVVYAFSPTVKKGRVIKQSPKAGTKLKANAKIKLVVSRGRRA